MLMPMHCVQMPWAAGVVLVVANILLATSGLPAQQNHQFDRIGVADGLSHNYVQSILCDSKGFLWFGTWDGLNRYDGRNFKVYKVEPKAQNSLTNNRIIDLWEDRQGVMWVKTNDGYMHYFVEATQEFFTFPYYLESLEERNSTISCFAETAHKEILLGSTNSGLYYLKFDEESQRYQARQYLNRGTSTISSNSVNFITNDGDEHIWIGTDKGLNQIVRSEFEKEEPVFSNYWLDYNFTNGLLVDSLMLFGTKSNGLKTYEMPLGKFVEFPEVFQPLSQATISVLHSASEDVLMVGTAHDGLYVYDLKAGTLTRQFLQGEFIKKVYQDHFNNVWVNTRKFGIYQIDPALTSIQHFDLLPESVRNLVDDERQFIFEDSQHTLWIALHGGGLAQYDQMTNRFEFYRNMPNDNTTISSDNVYCIAEDQSGILWVGTGPSHGGVNKVSTTNEAFERIRLESQITSGNENVVRSLLVDGRGNIWAGTKAGHIYILDSGYQLISEMDIMPLVNGWQPGQNAYTMMQDSRGYIWVGTKGGGLFVTQKPLSAIKADYSDLRFYNYTHNAANKASISSNNIYSIMQDGMGRIWIGTYGGGLNLVIDRNNENLICRRYNSDNTNLSSDNVRHLYEANDNTLWVATAFGLNIMNLDKLQLERPLIRSHLFDPRRSNSLSYNDVIHVLQDSKEQLWFGTSGGGLNRLLSHTNDSLFVEHLNLRSGLINDVVYAMVEDGSGGLWVSTGHGISRYDSQSGSFQNFDQSNNLNTDVFNENTCAVAPNGHLLFGTNDGMLVIKPEKIKQNEFDPNVALTNFQLFNKDVDIRDEDSPVKQDIETLDELHLQYYQSSFSIEYAALSYFAPTKNRYAFMLEPFDADWNVVGNQNKATYTNLPPGRYVFKVKAANYNSDWGDNTRSLAITIHPPWWKTNVMYLLYALLFIVVLEIIRRSYVRYHKLQNDLRVEKRVNDIKLQFFTNISHEIRTPLTLILGPIHDLLETGDIPEKVAAKLHLVENSGKRMLRLVNQLLDFRKIQKKKMTLQVHRVVLHDFVASIVENFSMVAEQKNLNIALSGPAEKIEIWVDPNKFDSVIFNILSNSVKYSPKGGRIDVKIERESAAHAAVVVTDQGRGIPENDLQKVFERFSPLTEENEQFGNSGIGLAYSKEVMQLHKGSISVQSTVGHGSSFIVKIRTGHAHFEQQQMHFDEAESVYAMKHQPALPEIISPEIITQNANSLHILIVEDSLQIQNYLCENLQKDYRLSTAADGQEALDIIDNNMPDLIITDLMMPVMDGMTLTRKIKNDVNTSHIPVIMLTAKSGMENQIEGIESGAEAYILKPFNMTYVRAVIATLLRQRAVVASKYLENKLEGAENIQITSKDEQFLNDVHALIMQHYADPGFNVDKLVDEFYVSRSVFYHKIKSLTGLTPIEFLRQKRLRIASALLHTSDYGISEIALLTGFCDVKNFSKRFKELFDMTPSRYREEKADSPVQST